jgi:hypothetical protein
VYDRVPHPVGSFQEMLDAAVAAQSELVNDLKGARA